MKILLLALFDEWCLGLRQISANLKQEGHDVSIAFLKSLPEMHGDGGVNDPEGFHVPPASVSGSEFRALLDLVQKLSPDLIGLGFTSSFSGLAQHCTTLIRTVSKAPVIWGGVDPTANPDISIQHADIVCIGEGDEAILDLTRRIAARQTINDIPNLWVRDGDKIHRNTIRPIFTALETLPFPDHEPANKYWISGGVAHHAEMHPASHLQSSYPIMTTRGCPYSCTFCCNSMLRDMYGNKNYVRTRPVEHVMAELREQLARNPKTQWIEIWDDVFGVNMNWAEEFADVYAREIGLPFWCYTYPAFIKPRLAKALKRAGVGFLVMGIQSGSQRILDEVYERHVPAQKVIDAAKLITDEGITLLVDLIDGYPFTTEEDNIQTLELMLQLPDGVIQQQINQLSFYRNYPLTDIAERNGITVQMMQGKNTAVFEETIDSKFWKALLTLTQFPGIPKENIRAMAKDPYLREHPEIVKAIADAMIEATYVPNTRIPRTEQFTQMHQEIQNLHGELSSLRDSRIVKMALSLRKIVGRPPDNGNGKSGPRGPRQMERSARAISTATDRTRQSLA